MDTDQKIAEIGRKWAELPRLFAKAIAGEEDEEVRAFFENAGDVSLHEARMSLIDELLMLERDRIVVELIEGLDHVDGDLITGYVVMTLLDRKEYVRARPFAAIGDGTSRTKNLLTIAETTSDAADMDRVRASIIEDLHETRRTTAGALILSIGVRNLIGLWRVSKDEKDLEAARIIMARIPKPHRPTALRAIARGTWSPEDVINAFTAIERIKDPHRRNEEADHWIGTILTHHRRLKGEAKDDFKVLIQEIARNLKDPAWGEALHRGIGDRTSGTAPTGPLN